MNLKGIMMSERSQSQKVPYFMILSTWHSWKDKNYSDKEQISACQGLGMRGGVCGYKRRAWRDPLGTLLYLDFDDGYMNLWHVLKFIEL